MAWSDELRAVLPACPAWEAWADAGAEPPPDLAALPARHELWSPTEGVADAAAWPARADAIRGRWRWLTGEVPAPDDPAGALVRIDLRLPEEATGPVPVLLVASDRAGWRAAAAARGWASCLVAAGDADDVTDDLRLARPDLDGSRLAWRAWALARAVDRLRVDPRIDPAAILVAGHSREGKAALLAAAGDARIAAVIASSSGVLGAVPARLCCDRHFGEGLELLTRHFPDWYHPRVRWLAGREQHLPTDAHELLALCAPRPVLVDVAEHDPVDSLPALRAAVAAARDAYALLGGRDALCLHRRPGGHAQTAEVVRAQVAWAAAALEGRTTPSEAGARPGRWRAALRRPLRRRTGPPLPEGAAWGAPPAGLVAADLRTRRGMPVRVLRAADASGPRPPALWLGPPCPATGWWAGYEQAEPLGHLLARAGWAVVCHDAAGAGARHAERVGRDDPLARMAADAREALVLAATRRDLVDGDGPRVAAAYGTGALVALALAARTSLDALALCAPTSDAAPPSALSKALRAAAPARTLVLDPRWDALAAPGAVGAACGSAGAHVTHEAVDDWHRLSGASRARLVAFLGKPGPAPAGWTGRRTTVGTR